MKTICVLQHVEAEYLGLMEDHFESRNIRFQYARPFVPGGRVPASADGYDGLVILGAGPFGVVSGNLLPSLGAELRLTADFLNRNLPVIGIEVGAVMLAVAAGGGAEEAPLRFAVGEAHQADPGALGGHMPERFPFAAYLRDLPVLSPKARTLAADEAGAPSVFAVGERSLGFLGHPGTKPGMMEDLIMEFDETPAGTADALGSLRAAQAGIAKALAAMMIGIVDRAGWMESETVSPSGS